MSEAEARALLASALASDDTPAIMDAFDRLHANGWGDLVDAVTGMDADTTR